MHMKATINISEMENVVYEAAKKILSESLFHRTYREGKPEKASDVIRGNGWDGVVVSKQPNEMIIRIHPESDAVFPDSSESLPFEELVNDLNIYYEDKGVSARAEGMDEYNGRLGYFIRIKK